MPEVQEKKNFFSETIFEGATFYKPKNKLKFSLIFVAPGATSTNQTQVPNQTSLCSPKYTSYSFSTPTPKRTPLGPGRLGPELWAIVQTSEVQTALKRR